MDEFWQSFLKLGETNDLEANDLLIKIMETSEFYSKHKFDLIRTYSLNTGPINIQFKDLFLDLKFSFKQYFTYNCKLIFKDIINDNIFQWNSYKFIENYGKQNHYI